MYQDTELIEKIKKEGCSDSLLELKERHCKLFYSTIRKFFSQDSQDFIDVEKSLLTVIYNSVMSYDPDKKVKFSTWLANQARYFCLNHRNSKSKREAQLDQNVFDFFVDTSHYDKNEAACDSIIESLKELLDDTGDEFTKQIIMKRYFSGNKTMNYSDIGKSLKVTAQTVLNWHNKFIKKAQKKLLTTQ